MDHSLFEANFRALMCAILLQAIEDATGKQERAKSEALDWLKSAECHDFLEWLDLVGVDLTIFDSGDLAKIRQQLLRGRHRRGRYAPRVKGGRLPRKTANLSRPASRPGWQRPNLS